MRNIRKLSVILLLCMLLCALPVSSANAAENGSLWLRQMPTDDGVTMAVCADTVVASGVITITYDSNVLAFQEVTLDSAYVLAHAINDQKAGQIRISWIGTGEAADGGYVLLRLRFTGTADRSAVLTGSGYTADGDAIAIAVLNLTGTETAVLEAEALQAEDYTADSFAAVEAAIQEAKQLLALETVTQAQLDAVTQKLTDAMGNLVVFVPEPPPTQPPATEPAPTDPTPTDPAPTQPATDPAPTQPDTQPVPTKPVATPVPKKNDSLLIAAGVVLGLVVLVAVVVILKKRGSK